MAFLVLITGIVGGLLIVFSVLLLCKYCLNRKNLREAEQMKLLYETLNQATLWDSNRLYPYRNRKFTPLEPRRSNPLDRYQLSETQWQIPSSKQILSEYHPPGVQNIYNSSHHDNNSQNIKQHDSHEYGNVLTDEEPAEQYLQVDPRCYVRQISMTNYKKPETTPRLEKGLSLNVDTRPPPLSSPSSLSPYRQSSFDVALAHGSQNYQMPSTPSSAVSTQQEIFFTPRGSSLSVMGNVATGTPPGSQHLSPPIFFASRQNSMEKKDVLVTVNMSGRESSVCSSIVQHERQHSRSLEHSSPNDNSSADKQSRSFDAVHLLRPDPHHEDAVANRRTKSYECSDDHSSPISPPPIVIKIPDMRELVQAARLQKTELTTMINNNHSNNLWRFDYEEQQQLDGTSPDELSPDLLTSTSIDSAGAMVIHRNSNANHLDDDLSKLEHRRKSSSNLLLPPPEVRRQALRRTFEKRRQCIDQSNARREAQLAAGLDDDYEPTNQSTEFSSLLNNFNSKSENSSFDRSLETDFDMQSDTSSREPNDHFTSIESSCNENIPSDTKQHLSIEQQKQSSQQDDSAYKSLESQNSHTFSLDWISADGVESVIYIDKASKQQKRSTDLEEDLYEQKISQRNQINPETIEQRGGLSKINLLPNRLITSPSFNRTASKKRREFSKDKRHAASNTNAKVEYQLPSPPIIHQIKEMNTKSTLQVRQADFRRSKSDETEILDSSVKNLTTHSNASPKPPAQSSSSLDAVLYSKASPRPIRLNSPGDARHLFQRSPSSTAPPVAISPQIIAFRSQRGSISFDNPIRPIPSPTSPLPTPGTKPRLKFSMVRDNTTASLGANSPTYSMPLANDLTIDEKTNRIINEFLMRDTVPAQSIRQNTFDETLLKQASRTVLITQRQRSFIQPNERPSPAPPFHFANVKNNSESPSLIFPQPTRNTVRRDNGIAVSSPSIIVTSCLQERAS